MLADVAVQGPSSLEALLRRRADDGDHYVGAAAAAGQRPVSQLDDALHAQHPLSARCHAPRVGTLQ